MLNLIFSEKKKTKQKNFNMSSAAVVIGILRDKKELKNYMIDLYVSIFHSMFWDLSNLKLNSSFAFYS